MENMMFLNLYKISSTPLKVVPAQRRRPWMNEHSHVYKCGPVTNCNSFGWDIMTIERHVVEWNGRNSKQDLVVHEGSATANSNFGHGVLTFNVGYTWHTPDGWSLYVTSVPNSYSPDFWTIDAMIETDILKYPFFPSVTLRKPGVYVIEENTAICRVFPIRLPEIIVCEPTITTEPQDFIEYRKWQAERRDLNKYLPPEIKEKWQKFYHDRANYPVVKMKEVKNDLS
jgi:hypothetical protein